VREEVGDDDGVKKANNETKANNGNGDNDENARDEKVVGNAVFQSSNGDKKNRQFLVTIF
jgi:hypothetical protein